MTTTAAERRSLRRQIAELKRSSERRIQDIIEETKVNKRKLKQAYNTGYNSGIDDFKNLPEHKRAHKKAIQGYRGAMNVSNKAKNYAGKATKRR